MCVGIGGCGSVRTADPVGWCGRRTMWAPADRKGILMVRRISVAVVAAALLLVGAATPAAAATVVSSWAATDIDGSNLWLVVYDDGWTYSLDDDASVCGGGIAKIYGPGVLDSGDNLLSAQWMVSCANGPLVGPFNVAFRTSRPPMFMRDTTGVLWHRTG